jgi:hypothetical protein
MSSPDIQNVKLNADPAAKAAFGWNKTDADKKKNPPPPVDNLPLDPVQFDTRSQDYSSQARAAGATRTGNDADLLGFTSAYRRAGQARKILG